MPDDFEYWAFISYSHRDEKAAAKLHRMLESYSVPRQLATDSRLQNRRLFPFFRDREELTASSSLTESVRRALSRSRHLIVLCSIDSATSHWVNTEVQTFIDTGRIDNIICCVLDDVRNIPSMLRDNEPLAADLMRDGWTNARLKIISALLQCRFDDLKQRDLQRTNRRMALIASAATAGVLFTSGLAAYALWAQEQAEQQRALANFHQTQAEDLVGFMVGDMREHLEPIGRLDILDGIGDEIMGYFASQPAGDSDATMVLRQARALRQIGEIRVKQARLAEGLDAFSKAMELLSGGLQNNGDHEQLLFEVSQLHFWIADAHLRQLDFISAEQHIESYRAISERLYELHPDSPDYTMEVAWAYNNLGTLALRSGRIVRAQAMFSRTLELTQALVTDHPENTGYRSELANTVSWLASIAATSGSLRESLGLYQQELQLRRLILSQSDDPKHRDLLAITLRWIGWTLFAMGQPEAGRSNRTSRRSRSIVNS